MDNSILKVKYFDIENAIDALNLRSQEREENSLKRFQSLLKNYCVICETERGNFLNVKKKF